MSTTAKGLAYVLDRELGNLAEEIRSFPDEKSLWEIPPGVKNSAGTLALHLVGNLQHYVGAIFGGTGYVRDRDAEFGDRDVPREQLLARIEACRRAVPPVLEKLTEETLSARFPGDLPPFMSEASSAEFMIHLTWHFGWHLGQVNYLRRLKHPGG